MIRSKHLHGIAMFTILWSLSGTAASDPLTSSITVQKSTDQAAAASQKKIDNVASQTDKMLSDYRQVTRQTENLRLYNDYVERLIVSQGEEMVSIRRQLKEIEITSREIVPLMLRMIDTIKRFVELDVPFLPQERNTRIANLEALMDRADVSNSEKFRRVIEAYQVEMEYGRTIEAYRDSLEVDGQDRTVDFLRIGRVGLYYQTLDGDQSGFWHPTTRQWETLSNSYRTPIRNGLRIAKKQAAPDLLSLPVLAPENVE